MLAQKLWAGEEYYLQIDSHMRFAPGWDEQLIHWLAACEQQAQFGKAVLSTYPPDFQVYMLFVSPGRYSTALFYAVTILAVLRCVQRMPLMDACAGVRAAGHSASR